MKNLLVRAIILCSYFFFSFNSMAEETTSPAPSQQSMTYSDIRQIVIDIRRLNVVFYRFMSDETNSVIYKKIPVLLSDLEQQWTILKSGTSLEPIVLKKLNTLFIEYQKVIIQNIDTIYTRGYPENQLVNVMLLKKTEISDTLKEVASNLSLAQNELLTTSYKQSTLMLDIAELYGELSVSLIGNPLVSDEMTLEEMCELFNTNLEHLSTVSTTSPESKNLIKSITKKWKFIERSVRNHQKNMVPFLVARYSDTILDKLNELNTLYINQKK
jgi:uncharacterized protein YaaR (DUF327 family)